MRILLLLSIPLMMKTFPLFKQGPYTNLVLHLPTKSKYLYSGTEEY